MRVLFLFMDGVGLGVDHPSSNPFSQVVLPHLHTLLEGNRLVAGVAPFHGRRASLLALDANLGVPGLPQSATGQAALLTGCNVPMETGSHYGPKPNPAVAEYLKRGTLFHRLDGKTGGLLNAYPDRYFQAIASGRRMHSAIPLAVTCAGLPLRSGADLFAGRALSADFTGRGWRERLGLEDTPLLTEQQAGWKLSELALEQDFSLYEYWPSDYAGHGQDMAVAVSLLEQIDSVLGGLLERWGEPEGLLLVASDHGNIEDLGTRRHTANPVPCLLVGDPDARREFSAGLTDICGIAPAIERILHG